MREGVYISYGFRTRAGSLSVKKPSKLIFTLGHSPPPIFFLFGSPWGYGSMVPQWGHDCCSKAKVREQLDRSKCRPGAATQVEMSPRSVAGALRGPGGSSCSVQERCRSVANPKKQQWQRPGALQGAQAHVRGAGARHADISIDIHIYIYI